MAAGGEGAAEARAVTVRLVTAIMVVVVGLSFLFAFGNVWLLALRLGVPVYVAPLVAPAVDLSVAGLLLGIRFLAVHGVDSEQLRPARRLLVFASMVTLALNVSEPMIAGEYGKAAFDSVGCWLLIGWAHVGPGLLQAMHEAGEAGSTSSAQQSISAGGTGQTKEVDGVGVPVAQPEPERAGVGVAPVDVPAEQLDGDYGAGAASPAVPAQRKFSQGAAAVEDGVLLDRARREDACYWEEHRRPISANELRKRLRAGSKRARNLVVQLRADAHRVLEQHASTADPPDGDPPAADPPVAGSSDADPDGVDLVDLGPVQPAGSDALAAAG